jgi:hypothetical protein
VLERRTWTADPRSVDGACARVSRVAVYVRQYRFPFTSEEPLVRVAQALAQGFTRRLRLRPIDEHERELTGAVRPLVTVDAVTHDDAFLRHASSRLLEREAPLALFRIVLVLLEFLGAALLGGGTERAVDENHVRRTSGGFVCERFWRSCGGFEPRSWFGASGRRPIASERRGRS